jgi:hypothetical protein
MSASSNEELRCHDCGSDDLRAVVQHGSYLLDCADCGSSIATSFLAAAALLKGHYRATVVDDDWNELELVATGNGPAFLTAVRARAAAGRRVRITPDEK